MFNLGWRGRSTCIWLLWGWRPLPLFHHANWGNFLLLSNFMRSISPSGLLKRKSGLWWSVGAQLLFSEVTLMKPVLIVISFISTFFFTSTSFFVSTDFS